MVRPRVARGVRSAGEIYHALMMHQPCGDDALLCIGPLFVRPHATGWPERQAVRSTAGKGDRVEEWVACYLAGLMQTQQGGPNAHYRLALNRVKQALAADGEGTMHRLEIKLNHIPTCTLVVVGAIAATVTALLAFLGAVLLRLSSLLAEAANLLNSHRHTVTSPHRWPENEPRARRNTTPTTIEGEYEVIDDGAHKIDRGVDFSSPDVGAHN
jgi:hypothetical protein